MPRYLCPSVTVSITQIINTLTCHHVKLLINLARFLLTAAASTVWSGEISTLVHHSIVIESRRAHAGTCVPEFPCGTPHEDIAQVGRVHAGAVVPWPDDRLVTNHHLGAVFRLGHAFALFNIPRLCGDARLLRKVAVSLVGWNTLASIPVEHLGVVAGDL